MLDKVGFKSLYSEISDTLKGAILQLGSSYFNAIVRNIKDIARLVTILSPQSTCKDLYAPMLCSCISKSMKSLQMI